VVAAIIGTGAVILISLFAASWHIGTRLARLEAKLENVITSKECGELREAIRKDRAADIHRHEEHHHEVSAVKATTWPPGGAVPS
jgi:hypothetical protein